MTAQHSSDRQQSKSAAEYCLVALEKCSTVVRGGASDSTNAQFSLGFRGERTCCDGLLQQEQTCVSDVRGLKE